MQHFEAHTKFLRKFLNRIRNRILFVNMNQYYLSCFTIKYVMGNQKNSTGINKQGNDSGTLRDVLTTTGDMIYSPEPFSEVGARLGIGNAGDVLTVIGIGDGDVPVWMVPSGSAEIALLSASGSTLTVSDTVHADTYELQSATLTTNANDLFLNANTDNIYLRTVIGSNNASLILDTAGDISQYGTGGVIDNKFVTNGDSYFNSGYLGIGTTTPESALHVTGDRDNTPSVQGIHLGNTIADAGTFGIEIVASGTSKNAIIDFGYAAQDYRGRIKYDNTNDKLLFSTAAAEKMSIASDGSVGIGTTTTQTSAKLEIKSSVGAVLFPRMNSTARDALTAVNGMQIYNSTTNKMQVYAGGAWVDLH